LCQQKSRKRTKNTDLKGNNISKQVKYIA